MPDDPQHIFKPLQQVHLTHTEHSRIRARLLAFMRRHPVSSHAGLSWWQRVRLHSESLRVPSFSQASSLAMASLVLVLSIGSGTTYASMLSLPGDPLYPLKTDVIEPLAGVLARSPQAKAEWSAELADRRLVEAEDLAAQGKLTPDTSAIVASQLQTVTQNFDASVQTMQADHQDAAVLDAQSAMTASLQAHTQVLAAVAPPSDQAAVRPIIALVAKHASSTNAARLHTQQHLADALPVAQTQQQAAVAAVDAIKTLAAQSDQSVDPTAAQKIAERAQQAQQSVDSGNASLAKGHYAQAMNAYQSAIVAATEANVRVDAFKRYKWRDMSSAYTTATSTSSGIATSSSATSTTPIIATTTPDVSTTSTPKIATSTIPTTSPSDNLDSILDSDNSSGATGQ